MTMDPDSGKFIVFIGGFALFLLIEILLPARRPAMARWKRLGFHLGIAVVNTALIRLLVYVPLLIWLMQIDEAGWGLSRWLGLTGWPGMVITLVVLDLFNYLWHRANHRLRFLWRFHKAHHSDTEMDLSTVLRFHPGELLLSALVKAAWIALWGPAILAWFVFEALVSLCAQFHHSNIDFPDRVERWLSWFIVTPRYHAAHHAVDRRYGNRNFATILSVWDRLLGTYARPADGGQTTRGADALGLPEGRALAFSVAGWLTEPLRHDNLRINASLTNSPRVQSN